MPKRQRTTTPEIVDLTNDGDQNAQVPPQVQPVQAVQPDVNLQPPLLIDLTEEIGVVVQSVQLATVKVVNGKRQIVVRGVQEVLQNREQQQQQQLQTQPQPGSSGLQMPQAEQHLPVSNSDSDSDSNSDSQMVHLGGGHACHVSKWVRHCNGEEVDLFGSDAEDEYVEPEPQPDDKDVQEPLSKKKK